MSKPLVSIVMPTYNRGAMIQNAILSIINQTENNWELIIVDDGSEDHTYHVVQQFKDDRIKYFNRKHEGMVASRNFGCSKAKANIIAHQDSDDLSLPDRIEKMLPIMTMCDVGYHAVYSNQWNTQYGAVSRSLIHAEDMDTQRLLREQYIPGVCFFKKRVWEDKPFRMETQGTFDWMMYLDWAFDKNVKTFGAVDIGLYEYVRTENSASQVFEREGKRSESLGKIKEIMKHEYSQDFSGSPKL